VILRPDEVPAWSAEADLIVVGYGIAGVCGAIEAREASAQVLVLERASGCSGSTAVASGHFYLGGGTAVQTACGFEDSTQATADYWTAVTAKPDQAKIDALAQGSVALFDWLEARGVPFDRSYFPTKAVIQPGRECLIWTGNEKVWPYRDQAPPAPRGHKVAFDGEEGGGALALQKLVEHAERIGVDARFDMQVDGLVMDEGKVIGVRARHFGERRFFRALQGVLLAGGGFGRNEAMMAEHLARFDGVTVVGGAYDDGAVINLGIEAGGAVEHMDGMLVTSPIYPPEQLVKGVLVNREGKRFIAEDCYHTRTSLAIIEQPGGEAYLIVDADIFAYPAWRDHANQQLVDGFATVAEMEERLGMPAGALQQTMAAYSRHAAAGDDPDFHKHPDWLKPLDTGPWAAFDFSYRRAAFYAFTLGGLAISADGQVLDEGGRPIAGLYAAGACASMLAHDAHNYASGISLACGALFGRRAGRHATRSQHQAEPRA
jgi:succinate dehydrogenase/fumarate reductase flavoprotein subunit